MDILWSAMSISMIVIVAAYGGIFMFVFLQLKLNGAETRLSVTYGLIWPYLLYQDWADGELVMEDDHWSNSFDKSPQDHINDIEEPLPIYSIASFLILGVIAGFLLGRLIF